MHTKLINISSFILLAVFYSCFMSGSYCLYLEPFSNSYSITDSTRCPLGVGYGLLSEVLRTYIELLLGDCTPLCSGESTLASIGFNLKELSKSELEDFLDYRLAGLSTGERVIVICLFRMRAETGSSSY